MEKLKSAVPDSLRRMVAESSLDDLPLTSSSLLDFLHSLPQFHQMVKDLSDPNAALCGKNQEAALKLKHDGNRCFAAGDHAQALSCYSQALRVAPIDADDGGKNLLATIYLNRASLFHKMELLIESLRDCSRALQLSPSYSKAWYRRGKVNASLGNHEDSVRDLTAAKNFEFSVSGKRQIESELNIISQHHEREDANLVQQNENDMVVSDVTDQINLLCVTTSDKGRGMASEYDIPQASLIHSEEPYAAIILKHSRESHCHYCFSELPADAVPCMSCSIPMYCSQNCQLQAGGQTYGKCPSNIYINGNHSNNLEEYVMEITSGGDVVDQKLECIPEHKHECQGVNWPAVLPTDIVLAGRVVMKSMAQKGHFKEIPNIFETLGLSQCYSKMPSESKLELHLYSIVLLFCLKISYRSELLTNEFSISQIIILLSQIRVNSMRIVHVKSSDVFGLQDQFGKLLPSEPALTSSMEQVRVGQAIYKTGSLFNHSCLPNIHAYFLSRTLLIRTTEFVAAGCPLEFSYGPQVGQWDCKDRLKFLQDEYFFQCKCAGCSEVNASDLFINGFCCINPNCSGMVLNSHAVYCENQKLKISEPSSIEPLLQVRMLNDVNVKKVAHLSLGKKNNRFHIKSGYCLECGSYRDLESSIEAANKAWIHIRRLQDSTVSREIDTATISDALRSLGLLRSTLHAYNKGVAEAEDNLAQAFCLLGDLKSAQNHCRASIKILEKLYGPSHIVIGHELVKLSSIEQALDDCSAVDSINRLRSIFSQYYGSHADTVFPYLQFLNKESCSHT
ncbi:hypothetical protein SLA2020_030220 [Shorea laevis]